MQITALDTFKHLLEFVARKELKCFTRELFRRFFNELEVTYVVGKKPVLRTASFEATLRFVFFNASEGELKKASFENEVEPTDATLPPRKCLRRTFSILSTQKWPMRTWCGRWQCYKGKTRSGAFRIFES